MSSIWQPREDAFSHPVAIIGAGVLGRRLATMWTSRGGTVHLVDKIPHVREEAVKYFNEVERPLQPGCKPGHLVTYDNVEEAVKGAWLVIESIPERIDLKIQLFGELDRLADEDAILATNSSSFRSGEMIELVKKRHRVLNIHAFMPPLHIPCEIMTCGETDQKVLEFMMDATAKHGFRPFLCLKEGTGFIFNRVWAAIKREALYALAQGTCTPESLDGLYKLRLGAYQGPFEMMDNVGLDTVLDIEEHYAHERKNLPEEPRQILKEYIAKGWLGRKSGRGFYDYSEPKTNGH